MYLHEWKYRFSHPLGWDQIPGPWLLVTALHTTNSLWADNSLRQTTEASPSGVDHLNVSWHGMIFSYNHCAQPSIRAQLKTSRNIASNVTKMADAGILLAMVVGILCKKRRKRWMEKVGYMEIWEWLQRKWEKVHSDSLFQFKHEECAKKSCKQLLMPAGSNQ